MPQGSRGRSLGAGQCPSHQCTCLAASLPPQGRHGGFRGTWLGTFSELKPHVVPLYHAALLRKLGGLESRQIFPFAEF